MVPFPFPFPDDLLRLWPRVDLESSVPLASPSTSGGGFARDERVDRRRTSDASLSLEADTIDVVRLRCAGRGGAGRESSSECDAEVSEAAGRGRLELARDLGWAVERKEVVLDLDFVPEASGKKGQERLDFLTRLRCSSLRIVSIVRVGSTIRRLTMGRHRHPNR
jgi:hypothetical protein